jgi:hypothetical protein
MADILFSRRLTCLRVPHDPHHHDHSHTACSQLIIYNCKLSNTLHATRTIRSIHVRQACPQPAARVDWVEYTYEFAFPSDHIFRWIYNRLYPEVDTTNVGKHHPRQNVSIRNLTNSVKAHTTVIILLLLTCHDHGENRSGDAHIFLCLLVCKPNKFTNQTYGNRVNQNIINYIYIFIYTYIILYYICNPHEIDAVCDSFHTPSPLKLCTWTRLLICIKMLFTSAAHYTWSGFVMLSTKVHKYQSSRCTQNPLNPSMHCFVTHMHYFLTMFYALLTLNSWFWISIWIK